MRLEDLPGDDDQCLWCESPLPEPRRITKQYCSKRCYQLHYDDLDKRARAAARSGRSCKVCSGPIDDRKPAGTMYCSKACARVAMRRNTWGVRRCRVCEAEFLPNHKNQVQCSTDIMDCVDRLKERLRCEVA